MTPKEIRTMISYGRANEIPAEELEIFKENEVIRPEYSNKGIKNLYNAICFEAVDDYRKARKKIAFMGNGYSRRVKEAEAVKAECERFFDTDFFKDVSGCNNKAQVIQAIEKQMRKEAEMAIVK